MITATAVCPNLACLKSVWTAGKSVSANKSLAPSPSSPLKFWQISVMHFLVRNIKCMQIFLSPFTYCLCCSHPQRGWRGCVVLFASSCALLMRSGVAMAFSCLSVALIQYDQDFRVNVRLLLAATERQDWWINSVRGFRLKSRATECFVEFEPFWHCLSRVGSLVWATNFLQLVKGTNSDISW